MWTRNLCLICIYILRNNAFQITNEASFLALLQPAATCLKFLLSPSSHVSKTSSAYSFNFYPFLPFLELQIVDSQWSENFIYQCNIIMVIENLDLFC